MKPEPILRLERNLVAGGWSDAADAAAAILLRRPEGRADIRGGQVLFNYDDGVPACWLLTEGEPVLLATSTRICAYRGDVLPRKRKPPAERLEHVNVRMSPATMDWVRGAAVAQGVTLAEVIRGVLDRYVAVTQGKP